MWKSGAKWPVDVVAHVEQLALPTLVSVHKPVISILQYTRMRQWSRARAARNAMGMLGRMAKWMNAREQKHAASANSFAGRAHICLPRNYSSLGLRVRFNCCFNFALAAAFESLHRHKTAHASGSMNSNTCVRKARCVHKRNARFSFYVPTAYMAQRAGALVA